MAAQDLDNELTSFELLPARQQAVGAGTQTYAGVDIKDYVGKIKCTYSSFIPHEAATNSVVLSILDSADNSTFAANSDITPVTYTASAATGNIVVDTRKTKRYIQGKHVFSGATMTVALSLVGVGQKQVI